VCPGAGATWSAPPDRNGQDCGVRAAALAEAAHQPRGSAGRTRALIVTPTRELAEQVHAAVQQFAEFTKIQSATVYGGVGMIPQGALAAQGHRDHRGLPGRLLDHIRRGNADLSHGGGPGPG